MNSAAVSGWSTKKPRIIAHRGASKVAPENTMAAFRKAVELGADAIELDVKLTADGVVAVLHDQTLDRTTNGHGKLSHHTMDEIRKLDAGRSFSEDFRGERIPTLEEVFLELGRTLMINVELTNYGSLFDDLPRKVVSLVRDHELEKRVLFSSFSPIAVKKTRELAPEIPSGLILHPAEPRWLRGFFRALTSYEAWHPEIRLVTKELVEREHARGRTVNVWVVNEAEKMAEMIALGVDGLITDAPDVAEAFLRELNHRVNTNDPRNR